jgi:hypothetical protein
LDLGNRVFGIGFKAFGVGFRVWDFEGSEFRVQGLRIRA